MVNDDGYYMVMMMVNNELVGGGIPTPLKNDGVRQLGKSYSQYMGTNVPNHPTRHNLFMPTRCTKI